MAPAPSASAATVIQVKFGAQRDPGGAFAGYSATPAAVKTSRAYSLQRLGTDYVDLYQPARLDPDVPIERDRLAEAIAGVELELKPDDIAAIEAAVPAGAVAGDRYDEHQMAALNSER